jgi:hypothetical protein
VLPVQGFNAATIRAGPWEMHLFVTGDTARSAGTAILKTNNNRTGGLAMNTENDIAALIELLKMSDERWPQSGRGSGSGAVSPRDLLREDHSLLEMWPEACRRTGAAGREFPSGVIELWKRRLGRAN